LGIAIMMYRDYEKAIGAKRERFYAARMLFSMPLNEAPSSHNNHAMTKRTWLPMTDTLERIASMNSSCDHGLHAENYFVVQNFKGSWSNCCNGSQRR
jgi:hypothetical protein